MILLEKAIELRATDIHVEPFRAGLVLRMRSRWSAAGGADTDLTCCRRH